MQKLYKSAIAWIFVTVTITTGLSYAVYTNQKSDQTNLPVKAEIYTENGVTFVRFPDTKAPTYKVEIADEPQEWVQGLMNRQEIGEDEGMLFVFPDSQMRNFWMKNTYIYLDIIFLDSEQKIINVHKNVQPLNEEKTYPSNAPSMYVLEIKGGSSDKYDIVP